MVKRRVVEDLKEAGVETEAAAAAGMEAGAPGDAAADPKGPGSEGDEAAAAAAAAAELTTPNRLQQFRKSRMWSAVTHSANVDIHEVRAGPAVMC